MSWRGGKIGAYTAVNDKDIFLYGGGTLRLSEDIVQESGGIYFDVNQVYTIEGSNSGKLYSWSGGGLDIGENTTVHWKANGVIGDALHKIGKGTLSIEVVNSGELNLGDGTVVLETSQKAFSRIMITSGRPTLKAGNQYIQDISTGDVLFLTFGGTFDLNGKNFSGDVIYAADSGAHLINTNTSSLSTITLGAGSIKATTISNSSSDKSKFMFHGEIGDGIVIEKTASSNLLAFDGNIYNPRGQIQFKNGQLTFQGHPVIHAYIDNSDGKTLTQIQNITGESNLYTTPTKLDQEDWESRVFVLDKILIAKGSVETTMTLGRDASLFSDIEANGASIYFGGDKEVYIDKYDGENIANQNSDYTKPNAFVFQQELTSGKNRKDDSFKFEGSIVGVDSNFYIANTSTNPLQFGEFRGVDRNNLDQKKSVDYKISLNSNSIFKANYVILHGGGEDKVLMDFASGQTSLGKSVRQSQSTISHLVLIENDTSVIRGDLSIDANSDLSADTSSSIHFTNAKSLLKSSGGTFRLGSNTELIFGGFLDPRELHYNQKIPLIMADCLDDQRSTKKVTIEDEILKPLNFQSYVSEEKDELGLLILRHAVPPVRSSSFVDNSMLNALSETNYEGDETFYDVALDVLILQTIQGRYASSLEKTINDAQNIMKNLSNLSYSYFSFNNLAINNYSRNAKLYLESKRDGRGVKKKLEVDTQSDEQNQTAENDAIEIVEDTYKSNNLWVIAGGTFASNSVNQIYGGELRGGYDGIFSDSSSLFSSLGFSINYTYTQANQDIIDTSIHGIYAGLHSANVVNDTHEILVNVYGGVQLGDSAGKISGIGDVTWINAVDNQSGFLLKDTSFNFRDILVDVQLFYKYIFTLEDSLESVQELKPIVGLDYMFLINQEQNIDIFKIDAEMISIPVLKVGLEYDYVNGRQIHSLSIFGNYNLNYAQTNSQNSAYVGTIQYTDKNYTSTQLFEASVALLYSWDIKFFETFSIDCTLKGEYFFGNSNQIDGEWFSVSGNIGANWRF